MILYGAKHVCLSADWEERRVNELRDFAANVRFYGVAWVGETAWLCHVSVFFSFRDLPVSLSHHLLLLWLAFDAKRDVCACVILSDMTLGSAYACTKTGIICESSSSSLLWTLTPTILQPSSLPFVRFIRISIRMGSPWIFSLFEDTFFATLWFVIVIIKIAVGWDGRK